MTAPVNSVFISYAREDIAWAQEIARVLRASGIKVFLDLDSIRAGDEYPNAIRAELDRADLVWLGWSTYSSQSEWVRREYEGALAKGPSHLRIDLLDDTALVPELKRIQAEKTSHWQPRVEGLLRNPVRTLPTFLERPSVLLRSEYGVVPFTGREQLLAWIVNWCFEKVRFSAQLFVGPAGSGKTRLVIEACKRLRRSGWDARFLDCNALESIATAEPELLEALFAPRLPRPIVMDYSETRRSLIKAFLDCGLRKQTGQPIRLILVARSATEWWGELLGSRYEYHELLGTHAVPIEVAPLAADVDHRYEIFRLAVEAYSDALKVARPEVTPPDLSRDHFDRVLFLHLASLAFVLGNPLDTPTELLDFILDHEKRYWERMADDLELPKEFHSMLQTAAATIVMAAGCASAGQLLDILSHTPTLCELNRAELKLISTVFRSLYENGEAIEPLQPDVVGEHLVARVLREDPVLRNGWTVGAGADHLRTGLRVLNRISGDHPEAREWLLQTLSSDLPTLAKHAVEVAVEEGDPIGRLMTEALRQSSQLPLAHGLVESLPHNTIALREAAAEITRQAMQYMESRKGLPIQEREQGRARLLNDLAIRLGDLGQREQALTAVEKAVAIYRRLASSRPDVFLPPLAMSLANPGNRLCEIGQRKKGVTTVEESVAIYRRLAKAQPNAFLSDLAMSLNNLAALVEPGQREKILAAAEEAVAIYRKLAEERPDRYLADLAKSLGNLATLPSTLGPRGKALAAAEEAVAIHRRLAEERPDAFLPDLAKSLNNLGIQFSEVGQGEKALSAAEEAVAIHRRLAEARPDAFLPDLAKNLNNLGIHLSALGQRDKALATAEETVAMYRGLAQARPHTFLPDLAKSLYNLANRVGEMGQRAKALETVDEAAAIYRRLREAQPNAFLPDLAMTLNSVAALADPEQREKALMAAEEAVTIFRELAKAQPNAFLPDLAMSLNTLAELDKLGQREESIAAVEEAVGIYRKLAEKRPDVFLPNLAKNLNDLAIRLSNRVHREKALAAIEEAVAILRRLAEVQPEVFQPDLALSLNNLGTLLSEVGQREKASAAVEEAVKELLPFLKRNPSAFESPMRTVARNWVRLGKQSGKPPNADLLEVVSKVLGPPAVGED